MSYIEASDTSLRKTGQIKLHGPSGFAGMRKAGVLVDKCLDELTDIVKAGVPTARIDDFVRDFAFSHGAYPATLMYRGYRYSTCTSINHVVCHGMPGDRLLKEGDIVNIDVTFILEGWYGDSNRMDAVGPLAVGAVRAFGRRHRKWLRNLHAVAAPRREAARCGLIFVTASPSSDNSRLQNLADTAWLVPMPAKPSDAQDQSAETPHYLGHRERLRERFHGAGPDALSDYELLEMVLFTARAQGDVKPLAKTLIKKFGSFAEVMHAPEARFREAKRLADSPVPQPTL